MKIHKEGYLIITVVVLLALLIIAIINYYHPDQSNYHYVIYFLLLLFVAFIVRFFRNPDRPLTVNDSMIISPADGKIVDIAEIEEPEFFKDKRLKVSIFMSPNNVHKNWYPTSGAIRFSRHHPGRFLVAWHPKSSELNERTTVVIEKDTGTQILVRQIAGAVAQRISCYAEVDKNVTQGEELGFIKFGSRVDIFLPLGTDVMVSLNQKVVGSNTAIARL
ncbi:MAG TPA: phosphatidylserine decarboxylase family protein [Bacteroidales bacterium]|nr:phosphatidylserine decarboxylase family protein [Bacteroidales bacterium]HPR57351.1 phosphatidylserine decarboxylase family protein [Bacteroidales bacterium]HRW97623.1 phosphatidylserine decarboxylase family protein [Bacteroidales bacterium]